MKISALLALSFSHLIIVVLLLYSLSTPLLSFIGAQLIIAEGLAVFILPSMKILFEKGQKLQHKSASLRAIELIAAPFGIAYFALLVIFSFIFWTVLGLVGMIVLWWNIIVAAYSYRTAPDNKAELLWAFKFAVIIITIVLFQAFDAYLCKGSYCPTAFTLSALFYFILVFLYEIFRQIKN